MEIEKEIRKIIIVVICGIFGFLGTCHEKPKPQSTCATTLPADIPLIEVHEITDSTKLLYIDFYVGSENAEKPVDINWMNERLTMANELQQRFNFKLRKAMAFHTAYKLSDIVTNKVKENYVAANKDTWEAIPVFVLASHGQFNGYTPIPEEWHWITVDSTYNRIFLAHESNEKDFLHEFLHSRGVQHTDTNCRHVMDTYCPGGCLPDVVDMDTQDFSFNFNQTYRNYDKN